MSLRVRTYERSERFVTLTHCPACEYPFDTDERRWKHFLQDHDPEDFGLDPLGVVDDCHNKLLFGGGRFD
ncbi:hypothetical protein [Halobacterium sp. R2-5]|uniref:hypothetical protein n=1 Tax=Halobacterium sp. R2-5 TaxID=2715751 RepID=UPI00142387E1|nr:hypothetical protein [Halobacterium sp. R2-5]NIB99407.1 hypothetical protein [Halobacterium sp. R2-5]